MNIVLYGVPAATAGRIADRYGLKLINSPDKFDASGTMVLVPSISAPRYLLAFYNAMLRHEDDVDAVVVCDMGREAENPITKQEFNIACTRALHELFVFHKGSFDAYLK